MKTKSLLIIAAAATAMTLCACSSDSEKKPSDSSVISSVTTVTTAQTSQNSVTTATVISETKPDITSTSVSAPASATDTASSGTTAATTSGKASASSGVTSTTKKKPASTTTSKKTPTTTTKKKTVTTTATTTLGMEYNPVYSRYGHDQSDLGSFIGKTDKKTKIPVINISTKDKKQITSRDVYVDCIIDLFSCDEKYKITGTTAGIKVRGNSTAFYGDVNQILKNQVPYRIKFTKKTNMLGLNDGAECKSWVLLKSNWNLVSDYMGLSLGNVVVEPDNYCSDCTFVHVYVNKTFKGVYLLCEQTQVNKNRVDVSEPAENYTKNDIGYLLEIDNYAQDGDDPWFDVNYSANASVTDIEGTKRAFETAQYSIKNDIYSNSQKDFIAKYINGVFTIMYEACEKGNYLTFDSNYNLVKSSFTNPKDTIAAVADLDSIVNMYILEEIVHDNDCGEGSFFMCVDFSKNSKYKKLTFTAPWDYNWGYEGKAEYDYYAGAFNDMSFVNQYGDRTNPWFVLLMTEDWFKDMVSERWVEVYTADGFKKVVKDAKNICNTYYDDLSKNQQWAPDCGIQLIDWVNTRMKWLDRQWRK